MDGSCQERKSLFSSITVYFHCVINSRNECRSFTEMVHNVPYGFVPSPVQIWNTHSIFHFKHSTHPQQENICTVLLLRLCQSGSRWTDNKKGKYTPSEQEQTSYQSFPMRRAVRCRQLACPRGRHIQCVPRASLQHLSTCQHHGTTRIARIHPTQPVELQG